MATFIEYAQQFAQDLLGTGAAAQRDVVVASSVASQVNALVDAFPYFNDPTWESLQRGALATLSALNLPNNGIAAEPSQSGFGYNIAYGYNGPYSGYQNAFYSGVSGSATVSAVQAAVQKANGSLNGGWWGNYGVVLLSNAVQNANLGVSIDSGHLANDLSGYFASLRSGLSASYQAVFTTGFSPTANVLAALQSAGQLPQAATQLSQLIANGQFTANINQSLAMGGDESMAATWFLFNLWIALAALGMATADVDTAIKQYTAQGLSVPAQVGPGSWWTGGYTGWFGALAGADVQSLAAATLTATMPEWQTSSYYTGGMNPPMPITINTTTGNGYSFSLCNWGSLNWYVPQSSSCFGRGTQVLLADGRSKPIETVALGDELLTTRGVRKVVLIETPRRAGRPLHTINDLALRATAAHPFCAAPGPGPRYLSFDPWATLDTVPTSAAAGVGPLVVGSRLAGWTHGEAGPVAVTKLGAQLAPGEAEPGTADELVYDLLLENWERDHPAYYVGGPDVFVATEAETVDPLYNPAITRAIVTALDLLVPVSRAALAAPDRELPHSLAQVALPEVAARAHRAARAAFGGKALPRLAVPGPDFYAVAGAWDPHASLVEAQLVRRFGRWLEGQLATGWRGPSRPGQPGSQLVATIFAIELVGLSVPAATELSLRLEVRGGQFVPAPPAAVLVLPPVDQTAYKLAVYQIAELAEKFVPETGATLLGELRQGLELLGQFRLAVPATGHLSVPAELFLFSSTGQVIGRVGVDLRLLTAADLAQEQQARARWTRSDQHALAAQLGKQLGYVLTAQLESYASL